MDIEAIISDLGNVHVFFDNRRTFGALARLFGTTPERVEKVMMVDREPLLVKYELGQLTDEQYQRLICSRFNLTKTESFMLDREFFQAYSDVFSPNDLVHEQWMRCKLVGMPLAALSNICPARYAQVVSMGVLDVYRFVVASFEVGMRKPDPRIYEHALVRLGTDAAKTLFVDDIAAHVDAAAKLGMIAHRYVGEAEFREFAWQHGLP